MGPTAFPFKLWDIVEHSSASDSEYPTLIQWNVDGNSILIDAINFEAYVAVRYPKFLRRSTLDSLQKQLYHYKFELAVGDFFGVLQYWHPCFIRGRSDLLLLVTNRQMDKLKSSKQSLPTPPPAWATCHGNYFTDDHCSESHDCPEQAKKLEKSPDLPSRPINRSTNQYKFWRRTGRIATFVKPHPTYDELAGSEVTSSYSLSQGDTSASGDAPSLLDFLDKTRNSLKEALEVGETATTPSMKGGAYNASSTPKMSLKVSLKNSLQQQGGNHRFTTLNTPPSFIPQRAIIQAVDAKIIEAVPRQTIVIAPIDSAVKVKSEPVEDQRDPEMMSTFEDDQDEVTSSSRTPPFAMLNIPSAIRIEPGIRDDWFRGEKRAYYAL